MEQLKVEDESTLDKKIKMLTLISLAEENQVLYLIFKYIFTYNKKILQALNLDELKIILDIKDEEMLEEFLIDAIRLNAISVNFSKNFILYYFF